MPNVDLRTALEIARSEHDDAESQLHGVEAKLEALTAEIRGLEMALARHNGKRVAPKGPTPTEVREWRGMHRTDAIVRVLTEADKGMSPREITDVLLSVGRKDGRKLVSAAIQYLKGEGRVHSEGRGQWVPGPENGGVS